MDLNEKLIFAICIFKFKIYKNCWILFWAYNLETIYLHILIKKQSVLIFENLS